MLFFHFALNQRGKPLDFSPADLEQRYGISRDRWRAAFSRLVQKGYLVQDEKKKYQYTFYSLPDKYKGITVLDDGEDHPENKDTSDLGIEHGEQATVTMSEPIPSDKDMYSDRDRVSPPTDIGYPYRQGEGIPTDKDSNNKDNKDILKDIKESSYQSNQDSISIYPKDEESLLCEKEELANDILTEFGHLDGASYEIYNIEQKAKSNRARYSIHDHVKELRSLLESMRKKRAVERSALLNNYRLAINATLPKDGLELVKVKLILDRYAVDHFSSNDFTQRIRDNYGMWINGWNDELQEPNMIIALYPLPESVIVKQKHNIEGIPKEYYMQKRP